MRPSFVLTGCGNHGEKWRGASESSESLPNQPINNVFNARDCGDLCRTNEDCEYWVYEEETRNCWLKQDYDHIEAADKHISGWKKRIQSRY